MPDLHSTELTNLTSTFPSTAEETQTAILAKIQQAEHLYPISIFSTGHSGCQVILSESQSGQRFVLKAPTDQHAQQEIINNICGYQTMIAENIGDMVPLHHIGHTGNRTYLVMEYLGADFASASRQSEQPEQLYHTLCKQMSGIYRKTRKRDGRSRDFLARVQTILQRNFHEYIVPSGVVSEAATGALLHIDGREFTTEMSCFGVFDFTPEDIFLTDHGIRYPDPKHDIRGNPIIDLACFGGIARDVMHLPKSARGYGLLEECAVNDVSEILGLTALQARKLFCLGRALQCSLSSRFRVKSDPVLAATYAERSLDSLRMMSDI